MRISRHNSAVLAISAVLPLLAIACFIISCGRVAAPVPPESSSPKFVEGFGASEVRKDSAGNIEISLSWKVPEKDQRNKKLNDLYGYRVYRKDVSSVDKSCLTEIIPPPPAADPNQTPTPIPTATATLPPEQLTEKQKHCAEVAAEFKMENFELLETIPDTAVAALQERKREAREKGEISRKVSLTENEKNITFSDTVRKNKEFAYKVLPYNSIFVELDVDILNFVTASDSGVSIKQFNNPRYRVAEGDGTGYFQSPDEE